VKKELNFTLKAAHILLWRIILYSWNLMMLYWSSWQ